MNNTCATQRASKETHQSVYSTMTKKSQTLSKARHSQTPMPIIREEMVKLPSAMTENVQTQPEQAEEDDLKVAEIAIEDGRKSPSELTWVTDVTSNLQNPSTYVGVPSSQIETQLETLARELELERAKRERLERMVEEI